MNDKPPVGGQAVLGGVMIRHGNTYTLAVRRADGCIVIEQHPWVSFTGSRLMRMPFLRGFPLLLETLINGIHALNRSSVYTQSPNNQELHVWQLFFVLTCAFSAAILLFVVLPHVLSVGMLWLNIAGDVEGLSFHLWDGLFKLLLFFVYILMISLLPDIRKVFRYHGAEHKAIATFEADDELSVHCAKKYSRLHSRCGTTFLLLVLALAALLHAVVVPTLFFFWTPENAWSKHLATIAFKLFLMIPISACAYELIHYTARHSNSVWAWLLQAPGLCLQMLTTWEPTTEQLEVALAALNMALDTDEQQQPFGNVCLIKKNIQPSTIKK